ncbi:Hypothetical protein HVR_LOCUS165 [uncultured virus]|nr:Hypothetical protein HVR_LOCUS165 [uncultured virus]
MSESVSKEPQTRIIVISSPEEARFAQKFMVGTVTVAFNKDYTAFAPDVTNTFIYSNKNAWNFIIIIFADPNVLKLISKPMMALTTFLKGSAAQNVEHLSNYMNTRGQSRLIPEMKEEIINQHRIKSLQNQVCNPVNESKIRPPKVPLAELDFNCDPRGSQAGFKEPISSTINLQLVAGSVSLIMSKYKDIADKGGPEGKAKKSKKSYFNKRRDCYLLYLTAFNDILSYRGPTKFVDLIAQVRKYSFLCRTKMSPGYALDGLIKVGALSNNAYTSTISIPDQMPGIFDSALSRT